MKRVKRLKKKRNETVRSVDYWKGIEKAYIEKLDEYFDCLLRLKSETFYWRLKTKRSREKTGSAKMFRISLHARYNFKEPFCHISLRSFYQFNFFQSFLDNIEGNILSCDKRSWDSYYYMYCDEGDTVYISNNLMPMT